MSVTRLSDVIVPDVFNAYMMFNTMVGSEVYQSGLVMQNEEMGRLLSGGGTTFQTP